MRYAKLRGAPPETALPVTTWLKTHDDRQFFALTLEADLRTILSTEALSAEVPLCGL